MYHDLVIILPELFLAIIAMVLLLMGAYSSMPEEAKTNVIFKGGVFTLFLTTVYLFIQHHPGIAFHNLFIQDDFARFMKLLLFAGGGMVLFLALEASHGKHQLAYEYAPLMLLAIIGMSLMVSANDLMALYLGLELQSLALYIMTAIRQDDNRASEASLKYFMLGALASGVLLFGMSFVYGFSGSTQFSTIAENLSNTSDVQYLGLLTGMALVLIGIFFKLAAAPFHIWSPDVYEGAFKPVTALFATLPKLAAIAVLVRLLQSPFETFLADWRQIMIFVACFSMAVGAFGALRQQNIKRLLAYSSIGHVGYILAGLSVGTQAGVEAALIYLFLYIAMNIGTFACIILMKRHDVHLENIGELSGLASNAPMLAFFFSVFMFSMAGVPPLAGFFGKFFVFIAVIEAGYYIYAVFGVLISVIAAFYYLKIVKIIYFDDPNEVYDHDHRRIAYPLIVITGVFNLLFFIAPGFLFEAAKLASRAFF